jgi:hypothetical protein
MPPDTPEDVHGSQCAPLMTFYDLEAGSSPFLAKEILEKARVRLTYNSELSSSAHLEP